MTPEKVSRERVEQILDARSKAICDMRDSGFTCWEIGMVFGLTDKRIWSICKRKRHLDA